MTDRQTDQSTNQQTDPGTLKIHLTAKKGLTQVVSFLVDDSVIWVSSSDIVCLLRFLSTKPKIGLFIINSFQRLSIILARLAKEREYKSFKPSLIYANKKTKDKFVCFLRAVYNMNMKINKS